MLWRTDPIRAGYLCWLAASAHPAPLDELKPRFVSRNQLPGGGEQVAEHGLELLIVATTVEHQYGLIGSEHLGDGGGDSLVSEVVDREVDSLRQERISTWRGGEMPSERFGLPSTTTIRGWRCSSSLRRSRMVG